MYEIEEKKLLKPPEYIDLSLKLIKPSNDRKKEPSPTAHRVEVAEINSNVAQSNRTESIFSPKSLLHTNASDRIFQKQMTRVDKKIAAARVSDFCFLKFFLFNLHTSILQTLTQMSRLVTSYDYSESTGPYYMP